MQRLEKQKATYNRVNIYHLYAQAIDDSGGRGGHQHNKSACVHRGRKEVAVAVATSTASRQYYRLKVKSFYGRELTISPS